MNTVGKMILLAAALLAQATHAEPVGGASRPNLVTGEIIANDAQNIVVPPSNSSPVVLRTLVSDGQTVTSGEVILRIDPGPNAQQVESLITQREQARTRTAKEIADLEVRVLETELAYVQGETALAKARIDAAIPRAQLSALDADRYAGEKERTERNLAQLQKAWDEAKSAVARKREDAALEVKKLDVQLAVARAQVEGSEVRAERDGVFVAGFNWMGRRFAAGENAWPGNIAGQIVTPGDLSIRAYALEQDRLAFTEGAPVNISIDAFPGQVFETRVQRIAGAPILRKAWGSGRYYAFYLPLPEALQLPVKPGMSVLIAPATHALNQVARLKAPNELVLEGELEATETQPVSPPSIPNTWNYNLVMLTEEGTEVMPGMPVAIFDASDLPGTIAEKRAQLTEKKRLQEKLALDHAEAERQGELAVVEARAKLEKAERKATQPEDLIRRVDYAKFVAEREEARTLFALSERKRDAQAAARAAERAQNEVDIRQLALEIGNLETGQQALTVTASRAGTVLHQGQWNGEKFVTGSQVFIGQTVANVADTRSLRVRAIVPEVHSRLVEPGQVVRVEVSGATTRIQGKVVEVGRAYRSKSSNEPINVLDVMIGLDPTEEKLKPGASVRVRLTLDKEKRA